MDAAHSPEPLAPQVVRRVAVTGLADWWLTLPTGLLLWGVLCRILSSEWAVNEQYSYGWFVPFFAAYLFWLRWVERPGREGGKVERGGESGPGLHVWVPAIFLLLLLLPLRLFEVANPDWRPVQWLHATITVGLTLLGLRLAGGWAWVRHFAFPVCFMLVAVPWVTPVEVPIVRALQTAVAVINTELMNLLGIPAQLEGSVIRLRTGLVGVNEACSGVRSLQTSIMAGLLFGELNRLGWMRRLGLLAAVIGLAFVANVARGGFLVWTAAMRGPEAVHGVHDAAGYAVLGVVMLGTFALAGVFRGKQRAPVRTGTGEEGNKAGGITRMGIVVVLGWLVVVELGVEGWYRGHERDLVARPQWGVRWPKEKPGYQDVKIDEITRNTLRYDDGGGVSWLESRGEAESATGPARGSLDQGWLMYFFRWQPGQTSVLRAKAHRPDVCFPNTGWVQTGDRGVTLYEAAEGLKLPFRHFLFVHKQGGRRPVRFAHAFFCLQEDRVSHRSDASIPNLETAGSVSGWEAADRIQMVREARRDLGQQVMEIVITTERELSGSEAEAAFARRLKELVKS